MQLHQGGVILAAEPLALLVASSVKRAPSPFGIFVRVAILGPRHRPRSRGIPSMVSPADASETEERSEPRKEVKKTGILELGRSYETRKDSRFRA